MLRFSGSLAHRAWKRGGLHYDMGCLFRKPRAKRVLFESDAWTIGPLKPWQLSQKVVLRATASRETDLSSTALPLWRRANLRFVC